MPRKKGKPKSDRAMSMVHPNAAAIDVGATLLMAAVRADRTPEPVRSFGTFTTDLHRLVDWFAECGVETVSDGIDQRLLDSNLRAARRPSLSRCSSSTRAKPSACRTQDRRQRRPVATAASLVWPPARQFSAQRLDRHCVPTCASANSCSSMRPRTFSTCRRR